MHIPNLLNITCSTRDCLHDVILLLNFFYARMNLIAQTKVNIVYSDDYEQQHQSLMVLEF